MVRTLTRLISSTTTVSGPVNWSFLLWWVLAGLVSYTVGFPVGLALGRSLLWGWVVGGGLVALLQWMLLRHQVTQAGWWVAVSMVGVTIGSALSFVVSQYVLQVAGLTAAFASVGAAVGISVGIVQWLMLRLRFRRAGWWVPASAAGYCLGLLAAVNAPVAIPVRKALIFGPEFGGLVGVISGAVTGVTMVWLLRRPVSTDEGTPGRNS